MSDDNIITFKKPEQTPPEHPSHPPMLNLPPVTKYFLFGLILIHIFVHFLIPQSDTAAIMMTFGFVPSYWTGQDFLSPPALFWLSPVTYMLIHGNLMHLLMNGAMAMAFGAGVEKVMGAKRYIIFFILCGLLSLIPEIIINGASEYPMVGASGALSGLFAAILIILQRSHRLPAGRYGIWPIAGLWIGISIFFGLFGSGLAGGPIAWLAHIGGFLGGLALIRLPYFRI